MSGTRAPLALFAACLLVACAGSPPPLSRSAPTVPKPAPAHAKLVVLWPPDSCEPGGYYAVVTSEGRFAGNVARGTRLEIDLAPGEHTLMAWNAERERLGIEASASETVIVEAKVEEGRTYFVRLAFGEWDRHGPKVAWTHGGRRHGVRRVCLPDAALVAMTQRSPEWQALHEWLDELTPVAADVEAGQAWLDGQPGVLPAHRSLAAHRWTDMRPEARGLATLEPTDGVALVTP